MDENEKEENNLRNEGQVLAKKEDSNSKKTKLLKLLIIILVLIIAILLVILYSTKGTNTKNLVDGKESTLEKEEFMHFSENTLTLEVNDECDLNVIMTLENINIENVTFESSNEEIAKVENDKIVTYSNGGTTTITAKYNNLETKLLVIVNNPDNESLVYSTYIKSSEYYLFVGESANIDYEYYPEDATDIDFSWTSSDSSIVSVNNGKITGKKLGKATITLKNNNIGCNVDEDYECTDTETTTVYVVKNKITFEYLENNEYKSSYEISDTGHSEYIEKVYEEIGDDYEKIYDAKYSKEYYIKVTINSLDEIIYSNEDFKISTDNTGATNAVLTYMGKDEKKENTYLYKLSYTFDEGKADAENHSDTSFTLPDGSTSIFRIYSEEAYYCYNACKPVLYLYPKKTINVSVKLKYPNYIITSYPKYNNGWNVTVNKNGDITDTLGKSYYALYWDEKYYVSKENAVDFKTGFYVEKENAIDFLEEKLTYIGLNDKERDEFIMYWLPILENNEKSLVYFELTDEREQNNKLNITPQPDSMLRVIIHVKKVDKKVKIKEQILVPFTRYGFTAVEWGGVNH